jgi:uncharacterized SAM-binding protein YcdF (DUF218 family)
MSPLAAPSVSLRDANGAIKPLWTFGRFALLGLDTPSSVWCWCQVAHMFYYVSKIFWFFAVPSNFLVLMILVGAVLRATRFPRTGQRLIMAGVLALLVAGLTPLSIWLLMPLETRFAPYKDDGAPVTGVVFLGGSFETEPTDHYGQMALNDAGERILAIAAISNRFPNAKLVYTGGGSGFVTSRTPEAALVENTAQQMGIPPGRILYERRSLNTHENATYAMTIAQPKPGERWLLVTSAFHMPRAMGVFRQAGWDITAYPVDFRTGGPEDSGRFFASVAQGLMRTDIAVKEYVGLAAYWVAGKTDSLFPAP